MTEQADSPSPEKSQRRRRCRKNRQHPFSGVLFGLIIIGVGALMLLVQLDILTRSEAKRMWPLAIVLFGLSHMFSFRAGQFFFGLLVSLGGGALLAYKWGYLPFELKLLWPVLIIALGLWIAFMSLVHRRRRKPHSPSTPNASGDGTVNEFVVFGGRESRPTSQDFRGGESMAIFGGIELDLSRADIAGEEAVLDARAVFGGINIRIPEHWTIDLQGTPIMGGFEDKTFSATRDNEAPTKRLVITGFAMFGGVEIRN